MPIGDLGVRITGIGEREAHGCLFWDCLLISFTTFQGKMMKKAQEERRATAPVSGRDD